MCSSPTASRRTIAATLGRALALIAAIGAGSPLYAAFLDLPEVQPGSFDGPSGSAFRISVSNEFRAEFVDWWRPRSAPSTSPHSRWVDNPTTAAREARVADGRVALTLHWIGGQAVRTLPLCHGFGRSIVTSNSTNRSLNHGFLELWVTI